MMHFIRPVISTILFLCLFIQAQAQGFYNSLDRAQPLGQFRVEISGNFAHQAFSYDGEREGISNTFGLRGGIGLSESFDIKFSWSKLNYTEDFSEDMKVNFFIVKPKISFGNKKVAFALPFGFVNSRYDEYEDNEQFIAPEIIFNHPFSNNFELGGNARLILPLQDDSDNLIGFSITAGLSSNLDQWVVRPEFGLLFSLNSDSEGFFILPGVSFSYFFDIGS